MTGRVRGGKCTMTLDKLYRLPSNCFGDIKVRARSKEEAIKIILNYVKETWIESDIYEDSEATEKEIREFRRGEVVKES